MSQDDIDIIGPANDVARGLRRTINEFAKDPLSAYTAVASRGLFRYRSGEGPGSRIDPIGLGQAADEAFGEVSGRNRGREAAKQQEKRVNEEIRQREQLRLRELEKRRLSDVAASRAAPSARRASSRKATRSSTAARASASSEKLGGGRDYLGL